MYKVEIKSTVSSSVHDSIIVKDYRMAKKIMDFFNKNRMSTLNEAFMSKVGTKKQA